jgi:predicted RNA binding protein YcfA (HicA-like mRNA interferase family)
MPKLYSYREIVNALKRLGFSTISQKGSHIKMRGIIDGKLQTAIIPAHKQIALDTLLFPRSDLEVAPHQTLKMFPALLASFFLTLTLLSLPPPPSPLDNTPQTSYSYFRKGQICLLFENNLGSTTNRHNLFFTPRLSLGAPGFPEDLDFSLNKLDYPLLETTIENTLLEISRTGLNPQL